MAQQGHHTSIFVPGRNCWRVEHASRAAFLIDADAYFKAFVAAAREAKRSILIVGWDFHSRTRLLCRGEKGEELELGPFLNDLARRRRELHIHVLTWDYPMIFGLDREWMPLYGIGWKPHHRVHFRYDNTHPVGGSHHQKMVVVDDRVAFCGGIDLTGRRWDTCDHSPNNALRVARGVPYPPFHDLAMAVEGDAARALGELARMRWRSATHHALEPPAHRYGLFGRGARRAAASRWPESVEADVADVEVAVSRTEPATNCSGGVREVETLYLDMIAAARRCIYIENQYFTADKIGDALAKRLQERDGPEIVVVLRELSHGWLEEVTMQTLRTRLIQRLRAADSHQRFRAFYAYIAGLKSGTCIDIHSKLMIVDDDIVRIGSANLANRSMGLDTECDLTIEARELEAVRSPIRGLRAQLLAEHLGVKPQAVQEAIAASGSMIAAIERLRREDRTLKELVLPPQPSEGVLSMVSVADPERPVELADLVKFFNADVETPVDEIGPAPAWTQLAAIVLLLLGLAALWKFTPLAGYLEGAQVAQWARRVGDQWWAAVATMLAYTPAALLMFPRPLITLFAVFAFGPLLGFVYAMLGIQLAAWVTFYAGQKL
ncbi:MAG TPA: phospholipase D-like domain-containing protein, partial [Steroidobacter sp.]|nr:phospholipase D-like domain-containing protein [Steroidobacter sp.]